MDQELKAKIGILEHLGYVMECLALNYAGEAKYELYALTKKIEESQSAPEILQFAQRLSQVDLSNLSGASSLSGISRDLWKSVMSTIDEVG